MTEDHREHHRKRRAGRNLVALAGATALAMGGSGIAYAYFTSSGSGTGSAQVGTAALRGFAVTTDGVGGTVLPGGPPESFDIDVQNVTGQPLFVGTLYLRVMTDSGTGDAATSAGTDIPGCSASWFAVTPSWAFNGLIPGMTTVSSTTMAAPPPTITMPTGAIDQNACQGVDVGIEFSTTPFGP